MKIAVFFVGEVRDAGFNASALAGAEAAAHDGLAEISIISGVRFNQDEIRKKLAETIKNVDGLVFIGGQGNIATPEIARTHPEKRFAVVQGQHTSPNLAAYDVRQEDSAFLAGVLAAKLTKTRIVGHLSGHRVPPGLKGRAAFAAGVAYADPTVQLLTSFCGTQDDSHVTRAWAAAQIDVGVDILFTMLNAARTGAITACQEGSIHQIGNALDWVGVDPDVFVGSAIARIDLGVKRAISDMVGKHTPPEIVELGIANGDYVSLSTSQYVPASILQTIDDIANELRSGRIIIPKDYDGPEYQPENAPCSTND